MTEKQILSKDPRDKVQQERSEIVMISHNMCFSILHQHLQRQSMNLPTMKHIMMNTLAFISLQDHFAQHLNMSP